MHLGESQNWRDSLGIAPRSRQKPRAPLRCVNRGGCGEAGRTIGDERHLEENGECRSERENENPKRREK